MVPFSACPECTRIRSSMALKFSHFCTPSCNTRDLSLLMLSNYSSDPFIAIMVGLVARSRESDDYGIIADNSYLVLLSSFNGSLCAANLSSTCLSVAIAICALL